MKRLLIIACLFFAMPLWAETVTRVVDGDTVVLDHKTKVRLIGVDTPELHKSKKLKKDAAATHCEMPSIESLGKKASDFTTGLVLNKEVTIEYGDEKTDKYHRTLAYLYLKDGTFVNLKIIEDGYSRAYTRFPFKYKDRFVSAEAEAKKAKRGLWSDPKCL